MEELNPIIVKGFGRKLKCINKSKGAYICTTDKGLKQVRKVDVSTEIISSKHNMKEILFQNGFTNIDRYNVSIDGTPYYILNDVVYIMLDFLDGVECNLEKDLFPAVKQLANMHNAAVGVKVNSSVTGLDCIVFYKKRLIELCRLKKRITQMSSLSELDILILKNFDYYYNLGLRAVEILEKSSYKKMLAKGIEQGSFFHNNYREENIILANNMTYIVNFDSSEVGLQMVDLVNLICRYMKKEYANIEQINRLIEEYSKIKEISKEEFEVLFALLLFPHKFLKICNKYYNRRKNWVKNGMLYSLEMYLKSKEKYIGLYEILDRNI